MAVADLLNNVGGWPMSLVLLASGAFLAVCGLVVWVWFTGRWNHKALIFQEVNNGAGYFVWSRARIFTEDKVKQMRVLAYSDYPLPPPTLDTIVPMKGGVPVVLLWRDVNGNIHSVRWTRFAPVLIEDNDELVQLEAEALRVSKVKKVPVEQVKKQGWWSNVKQSFVRLAKLKKDVNYEKHLVALREVLFEPDNRSGRVFMAQALRRNHEKHNVLPWWQQPWFAAITTAAICMLAVIITGYFTAETWNHNIDRTAGYGSNILEASKNFKEGMLVAGPLPQTQGTVVAPGVVANSAGSGGG
jgi:hypothetical protein